jgi:CBS domain-containing protein
MAARIQAAMARRGLSREQAETYIAEVDRQRARWVQTMYGEDCSDPRLYDFVVNLEQVSVAHAAEVVCGMARQPEFVPTAHSRTKLRDLALSARARATLLLDAKVPQSAVVAESRDGVLHLWGRDYLHHHRDAVLAALSRVPGVGEIVVEGDRGRESPISGAQSGAVAREIMLPIAAYPSVRPSTTIREALVALGSSTVKLHDGHLIPPRYLLVISETGELLGLLTRRDLLRGLSPHLAILEQTRQEVSRIVPFAAAASSLPFSWVSFFSPSAVERSKEPVRAVMNPIRGVVDAEADLSSVVSTMLSKQIDLVPVIDGGRVQGVIVMTDVFDRVAEYVLEHGGSPQG